MKRTNYPTQYPKRMNPANREMQLHNKAAIFKEMKYVYRCCHRRYMNWQDGKAAIAILQIIYSMLEQPQEKDAVTAEADWQAVKLMLIRALDQYPDARKAVVEAINHRTQTNLSHMKVIGHG